MKRGVVERVVWCFTIFLSVHQISTWYCGADIFQKDLFVYSKKSVYDFVTLVHFLCL